MQGRVGAACASLCAGPWYLCFLFHLSPSVLSVLCLFPPSVCLLWFIVPFFFFYLRATASTATTICKYTASFRLQQITAVIPSSFLFFFFVGMNNWWSGVVTRLREKSSRARCLSSVRMKQTVKRLNPCFTDYLLAAFTVIHGPFYTALERETHLCSFPCRFAVRAVWQMKPRWTR